MYGSWPVRLATNPRIAKIVPTGSTAVGSADHAICHWKRNSVMLELGGKSPKHLLWRHMDQDDEFLDKALEGF
jgi:acyl-CoA reductase-like NAD-dependent aldehyde dehydrogenase